MLGHVGYKYRLDIFKVIEVTVYQNILVKTFMKFYRVTRLFVNGAKVKQNSVQRVDT